MQSNKITEISLIRKISFLGINKLGTWNCQCLKYVDRKKQFLLY